jgi:hypothetical protein
MCLCVITGMDLDVSACTKTIATVAQVLYRRYGVRWANRVDCVVVGVEGKVWAKITLVLRGEAEIEAERVFTRGRKGGHGFVGQVEVQILAVAAQTRQAAAAADE